MTRTRLFSSAEIEAALRRGGFTPRGRSRGSHQAWTKQRPDGSHRVVIVVCDKPEVPKGTFDSILEQAGLTYEQFLALAKVKKKGQRGKPTTTGG